MMAFSAFLSGKKPKNVEERIACYVTRSLMKMLSFLRKIYASS